MKKLHYHGVRNNTLGWFHSNLTNRAQYMYTEYNETKSSLLEIRVARDHSSWNSLTFPWQFPDIVTIFPDVIQQYFI